MMLARADDEHWGAGRQGTVLMDLWVTQYLMYICRSVQRTRSAAGMCAS